MTCSLNALLAPNFLTCKTIFLWMANLAMMWARSRWPLYLQAGSTQALGNRQGQAKVMSRLSLLFLLLLLSWIWWGACSTSNVENCSRLILSESRRSDCFSGSRTCKKVERKQTYKHHFVLLKILQQQVNTDLRMLGLREKLIGQDLCHG